jgi:glycosyltransferase involved in cell wall biosynthesis
VLDKITPVILTLNEAPNIARALALLRWAQEVVVLDSGSTDGTREITSAFPNVRFWSRPLDTLAGQWNAALADPQLRTEWVLALDADYTVPAALTAEMTALSPAASVSGYRAHFSYAMDGRVLRASLYPPHVVLFRRARGRYVQDGHAYRLVLDGMEEDLRERIIHDDRKPFRRWLASQRRYAHQEAERLATIRWSQAGLRDRIRKTVIVAPWTVPLYTLLGRRVALDGLRGLRYALERAIAEALIAGAVLRRYLAPGASR